MSENTKIEWSDATFNPWIGCTKISPGCDGCYAARQDEFRKWTPEGWGGPRKRTSEALWALPVKWNRVPFFQCLTCGNRFGIANRKEGIVACNYCQGESLKQVRRRVFCASLADVFDNEVDPTWRVDLFRLIAATPNLDWLLLTKRIGNAWPMMLEVARRCGGGEQPLDNVWLGATIVDQAEADRDIPKLLAVPARVRFLSMEPLLGPVDLTNIQTRVGAGIDVFSALEYDGDPDDDVEFGTATLDWVIVGGESGPKARPMHPDWARSLRDQCAAAGVPFLFKQWGCWAPGSVFPDAIPSGEYCDFDGALKTDDERVWRVPKKAAGRLLDGVEHNGFPEVAR